MNSLSPDRPGALVNMYKTKKKKKKMAKQNCKQKWKESWFAPGARRLLRDHCLVFPLSQQSTCPMHKGNVPKIMFKHLLSICAIFCVSQKNAFSPYIQPYRLKGGVCMYITALKRDSDWYDSLKGLLCSFSHLRHMEKKHGRIWRAHLLGIHTRTYAHTHSRVHTGGAQVPCLSSCRLGFVDII